MVKLYLTVLMAILAVIWGCPYNLDDTDSGESVSYNGSIVTFYMKNSRNGSSHLGHTTTENIRGCIRASIVREQNRVEVSVQSCYGSEFGYDRELTDAFAVLQTSSMWILEKQVGLVRFTQCWTGGSISFDVSINNLCKITARLVEPCRTIASGRKKLKAQYGQMKSFDARDMLPKGRGSMVTGHAVVMMVGLLLSTGGAVALGGY